MPKKKAIKGSKPKAKPPKKQALRGKKKEVKKPPRTRKVRPKVRPKIGPTAPTPEQKAEALRRLLIQRREQIVREAKSEIRNYITGENRQLVETALDDGDWSVVDLSEDISLKRLTTHREMLLKIDEALRKLKEGTYGICDDCSEDISPERLRVLPFAIYCRDCQEKKEHLEAVERAG